MQLQAQVNGGAELIKKSIYLNNSYIGEMNLISSDGDTRIYGMMVYIAALQSQNELRVRVQDSSLDIAEDVITINK
jgi:hypothetical protein